ncbi:MAG: aspartyl-tRNA(Asn)/glutamyl-tRNA(Gln) amidotransferase subunit [Bryobacterales bacterium]|jgi:aspartyl-tRNA(Asn)/glutamyl-tRNA(Gln) amidotransferase subunit A|nr:aspartyl-tRNA(Asn)/glutamyl-tRNA(Gln) amidotransferase subunit [Bryobacterales bacterium]
MNIEQAAAKLRAREVSAVELAQESLDSIRRQEHLNAFITVTDQLAMQQARQADDELAAGVDRGPLHGIPYALKDVFCTKGIRTTLGSKIFADHVPDHDSAVYEKLTAAGAVLMGKTSMQEFAYGITCNNPHFGAVRNPHDPQRIPGGSSGGSGVAVAADMVFFAMGSDTGGSIRNPAAYCGCVGLKPTSGRVSRFGVLPLDFSLDHMGPLTRTPRDAGLVLNAIAGPDERDDTSSRQPTADYAGGPGSLAGKRVGLPENFFNERIAPEVTAAFAAAVSRAEAAGAKLVKIRVPDPAAINVISRMILMSEASAVMEPYLHRRADFGSDVLALFDQGRLLSATDYINAQRLRRITQKEWAKLWNHIDCIFTPTAPILAPLIGETHVEIGGTQEDVRLASTRFVRSINVLGIPAISIPLPVNGLPIGLQIIARPFAEQELLSIASALSSA